MKPFPKDVAESILIAFIDQWVALLELEDYDAAFTDHIPEQLWTPALIREVIKNYGGFHPDQRVTVDGSSTDIAQVKELDRRPMSAGDYVGEIWYDLNINGMASDLTATFWLKRAADGITVYLNDVHVK